MVIPQFSAVLEEIVRKKPQEKSDFFFEFFFFESSIQKILFHTENAQYRNFNMNNFFSILVVIQVQNCLKFVKNSKFVINNSMNTSQFLENEQKRGL